MDTSRPSTIVAMDHCELFLRFYLVVTEVPNGNMILRIKELG
jgi:hypothetical protein